MLSWFFLSPAQLHAAQPKENKYEIVIVNCSAALVSSPLRQPRPHDEG
jgi:hypothetical protein